IQQLREMIADSGEYYTWRTFDSDVAMNQTVKSTGENTPVAMGAPSVVYLAKGVKGLNYGSYAVCIKGASFRLRSTPDAAEWALDGEIPPDQGVWYTMDDYNAAKGTSQ